MYNDLQEKCEQVWKEFCQKREQENKPIKDPKKFRLPLMRIMRVGVIAK